MSKGLKGFFSGLLLVAVIALPACRNHTKKTEPQVAPTTSVAPQPQPPVPNVPTTPTVEPPSDFVKTETAPSVSEENLPPNIEEANRVAQERGYIRDAFFAYDASTLSSDAQDALTTSANFLKKHPEYNLLIEGHCDERGTEQYNLALGDRRAQTAKDYLATLGVETGRMRTVSYGEERPFDAGHNEEAWAKNRRDHLVLVGK